MDFEKYGWDNKAYFLPIMRDEVNKNDKLIQNLDIRKIHDEKTVDVLLPAFCAATYSGGAKSN